MQVKDETSLFPSLLNLFLDMVDGRRDVLGWFLPDSVGINSSQLCSRIAVNNSVRIDHWNDLEDVVVIERVACLNCLYHEVEQVGYHAFHHETRSSFNGMLSC